MKSAAPGHADGKLAGVFLLCLGWLLAGCGASSPAGPPSAGPSTGGAARSGAGASPGAAEASVAPRPSAAASPAAPASSLAAQQPATSVAAKPSSSAGSSATSAGQPQPAQWAVYHATPTHTGVGPDQPLIGTPKQLWSTAVDGAVYGEPLVDGGRVYVVTENDSAYALDANDGKVVWQSHVGSPVPRSSLPCGNIDPSGMTATPAISNGVLYASGRLQPAHHELFGFDLATGQVKFRRTIDPPGADPRYLQERSAVLPANGRIYVAFGGNFGDCGPYKGWVVASAPDGRGNLLTFSVPTQREGAIWATPGPSLDANGDLLVAVGNAASVDRFDYGNAVIRLSPDLKIKDYWAPADWAELSRADRDIGSISPAILQNDQTFQSGKNGIGYLLKTSKLGNIGGELYKGPVCGAAFSGTAYRPPMLYVPCSDGLVALRIGAGTFDVAWRASARASNTAPIVAYGSVWQVDPAGGLLQFDPTNGQLRNRVPLPTPVVAHFLTPSAADGKVFVTSGSNVLAFGG